MSVIDIKYDLKDVKRELERVNDKLADLYQIKTILRDILKEMKGKE